MVTDAYAAGVFDGEGTIGIYPVVPGGTRKSYWMVRLAIVGTHRPMIESLYRHFRVGLFTARRQKHNRIRNPRTLKYQRGKQGWIWAVSRREEIEDILKRFRPFLHEKARQADVVMAFIEGKLSAPTAARRCKKEKKFEFSASAFKFPERRHGGVFGANNHRTKLTPALVHKVRRALTRGASQTEIGSSCGISQVTVSRIARRKTWLDRRS
jgi:hypothetical protein